MYNSAAEWLQNVKCSLRMENGKKITKCSTATATMSWDITKSLFIFLSCCEYERKKTADSIATTTIGEDFRSGRCWISWLQQSIRQTLQCASILLKSNASYLMAIYLPRTCFARWYKKCWFKGFFVSFSRHADIFRSTCEIVKLSKMWCNVFAGVAACWHPQFLKFKRCVNLWLSSGMRFHLFLHRHRLCASKEERKIHSLDTMKFGLSFNIKSYHVSNRHTDRSNQQNHFQFTCINWSGHFCERHFKDNNIQFCTGTSKNKKGERKWDLDFDINFKIISILRNVGWY